MKELISLTQINEGETVIVHEISAPGGLRHRLLSFGIAKGSEIKVEAQSFRSSTLKIVVNNTKLALRSIEADTITVRKK